MYITSKDYDTLQATFCTPAMFSYKFLTALLTMLGEKKHCGEEKNVKLIIRLFIYSTGRLRDL